MEITSNGTPNEHNEMVWVAHVPEANAELLVYTYPFSGYPREGCTEWYFYVQAKDAEGAWQEVASYEPNGPSALRTELTAVLDGVATALLSLNDM